MGAQAAPAVRVSSRPCSGDVLRLPHAQRPRWQAGLQRPGNHSGEARLMDQAQRHETALGHRPDHPGPQFSCIVCKLPLLLSSSRQCLRSHGSCTTVWPSVRVYACTETCQSMCCRRVQQTRNVKLAGRPHQVKKLKCCSGCVARLL